MRIRTHLKLKTRAEWDSLPDSDKVEWMQWDTYRQQQIRLAYNAILESSKPINRTDTTKDPLQGSLSPEVHTLLILAELD